MFRGDNKLPNYRSIRYKSHYVLNQAKKTRIQLILLK